MQDLNDIALFTDNRVKPAIDKVSICGRSDFDILHDDIENLVAKYGNNQFMYKHKTSEKYMGYRRLHEISYCHYYDNGTYEVFTLALLIGLNGNAMCGTLKEQRKFKIEFNPQKFKVPMWLSDYFSIRAYQVEEVKNIDLAFDLVGFCNKNVSYILHNGHTTTATIGTQNNKTQYIGFADKADNRIKIYDKKKERQKYYEMERETTRVEITLKYVHTHKQNIYYNHELQQLKKSALALSQVIITSEYPHSALTYALSCLTAEQRDIAFSLMSQNSRKKYKDTMRRQSRYMLYADPVLMADFINKNINLILEKCCIIYRYSY